MSRSQTFNADIKIAKTFAIIYGDYVIFWTPGQVVVSVISYMKNSEQFTQTQLVHANFAALCLIHLNSALNPLIYAYRIKSVRETIKRIFESSKSADCSTQTSKPNQINVQ